MEDGFWLFIILQFAAMGPLADLFHLGTFRKVVLGVGTMAAVAAALVSFTLAYVTVSDVDTRHMLEWAGLGLRAAALILTALALIRFW
ncbi:MAG: hypothetical protein ACYSUM_21065 [Planctomycetota bacterium]|jgi:hypothetical protein